MLFRFSWSHLPSCPGTSSFTVQPVPPGPWTCNGICMEPAGHPLGKATGSCCWQMGARGFGRLQASLLPAVLGRQEKESMSYPGVMFSAQLSSSSLSGKQAKDHAETLTTAPSHSVDTKDARAVSQKAGVSFGILGQCCCSSLLQSSLSMQLRTSSPGEHRCLIPIPLGIRCLCISEPGLQYFRIPSRQMHVGELKARFHPVLKFVLLFIPHKAVLKSSQAKTPCLHNRVMIYIHFARVQMIPCGARKQW